MKRISYVGLALFLLTAVSARASWAQCVIVDFNKAARFSFYETYACAAGTPAKNPLLDQRNIEEVDMRMVPKGFRKVEISENPDLIALCSAAVGTETQLNSMNTCGYGWGYRCGSMGTSSTTAEQMPVGALSLDICDAKTNKLLCLGQGAETLSIKPEKVEKTINKLLDKMLKKFPPPIKN